MLELTTMTTLMTLVPVFIVQTGGSTTTQKLEPFFIFLSLEVYVSTTATCTQNSSRPVRLTKNTMKSTIIKKFPTMQLQFHSVNAYFASE